MFLGFPLIPLIFSLATQFLIPQKRQKTSQGKKDDRSVEPSGYSSSRSLVHGRQRVKTVRVYTEPLRESKKSKKKKGGQQVDTYTYFFTGTLECGIPLLRDSNNRCVGFIPEEIFANGELYWNLNRDGATIDRDVNGRVTKVHNEKFSFRFYPGNDVQVVEDFISEQMNNSSIKHFDTVLLHFDDLPIQKWGAVPDFEVLMRSDDYSESIRSHHNAIRELFKLAGIDPTHYTPLDPPVALEGFTLNLDDGDLTKMIDQILTFAQGKSQESFGKFVTSRQSLQLNGTPFEYQTSKHCSEPLVGETENREYKVNGFTIKFSDVQRNLDISEYTHAIANDDTAQTNIESLDFANFAMNMGNVYQMAEYATARNYYKFNKYSMTLVPMMGDLPAPNYTVLVSDDITLKNDIYGIIDKVTLNADFSTTVNFTDYPYQVDVAYLEDNDEGTVGIGFQDVETNSLIPIHSTLLNPEDATLFGGTKGQYLLPELDTGGMEVFTSLDGVNFRYGGQAGDKKVIIRNQQVIAASAPTAWLPTDNIDFIVEDSFYIQKMDADTSDDEAQNRTQFTIYSPTTNEMLSWRRSNIIGSNLIKLTGLKRGYRNGTGVSYPINTEFWLIKSPDAWWADIIEIDPTATTGQTIYYKLAAIGSPYRQSSVKSFIYDGLV